MSSIKSHPNSPEDARANLNRSNASDATDISREAGVAREVLQRLDALERAVTVPIARLEETTKSLSRDILRLEKSIDSTNSRIDRLSERVDRVSTQVAWIIGGFAAAFTIIGMLIAGFFWFARRLDVATVIKALGAP